VRDIIYPVIAMAVILPLFYLLMDLKIGMRATYPFGGNRGIYGSYAVVYFSFLFSLFSILCGVLFKKLFKKEIPGPLTCDDSGLHNLVFHLPVFIYFAYIVSMLLVNGFIPYAAGALALFSLVALSFGNITALLLKLKAFLVRFVQNERLFLVTIFVIAFLIRYIWGFRLLGIAGDRFPFASDDGIGYDAIAAIFAQGKSLSRVPNGSGFAYWYFLASLYKIFGLHNFKAVIIIQAAIGSLVPVGAYFIAKRIFKSIFAPVVASVITCFDMTLIFLSAVIGMEAIYVPLVILALIAAVDFLNSKTVTSGKAFLLGSLFGLAYLARPPELIFFPFIIAVIAFIFMRKKVNRPKMFSIVSSLFLGFVLLLSVQYAVNYLNYGKGGILTESVLVASFTSDVLTNENLILGQMGFNPFADFKGTLSVFAEQPLTVLHLIAKGFSKRLMMLYFFPNFGIFDPIKLVNTASGYFFRYPVYVRCLTYLFMVLGTFAAFAKRKNLIGLVVIFSFLIYRSLGLAFFFVLNARYRSVFIPLFLIFVAYGIEVFYKRVKASYHTK
jgi:hypothetical protein